MGLVKICLLVQSLSTWRDLWDSTEQMLKTQTPQLNRKCQAKSFTDLINSVFPLAGKKSGADTGFLCFSKVITLNCPSLLCSIGNQTSCRTQLPSVFRSRRKGLAKLYKASSLDNNAHWFFTPAQVTVPSTGGTVSCYFETLKPLFFFWDRGFKHLWVEEIINKTRTTFLSYPFWVSPSGYVSVHLFLFNSQRNSHCYIRTCWRRAPLPLPWVIFGAFPSEMIVVWIWTTPCWPMYLDIWSLVSDAAFEHW